MKFVVSNYWTNVGFSIQILTVEFEFDVKGFEWFGITILNFGFHFYSPGLAKLHKKEVLKKQNPSFVKVESKL